MWPLPFYNRHYSYSSGSLTVMGTSHLPLLPNLSFPPSLSHSSPILVSCSFPFSPWFHPSLLRSSHLTPLPCSSIPLYSPSKSHPHSLFHPSLSILSVSFHPSFLHLSPLLLTLHFPTLQFLSHFHSTFFHLSFYHFSFHHFSFYASHFCSSSSSKVSYLRFPQISLHHSTVTFLLHSSLCNLPSFPPHQSHQLSSFPNPVPLSLTLPLIPYHPSIPHSTFTTPPPFSPHHTTPYRPPTVSVKPGKPSAFNAIRVLHRTDL